MGATYVLMALAPNLWWLAFARILSGITASSIGTTLAYLADITPPESPRCGVPRNPEGRPLEKLSTGRRRSVRSFALQGVRDAG